MNSFIFKNIKECAYYCIRINVHHFIGHLTNEIKLTIEHLNLKKSITEVNVIKSFNK